MKSSARRQEDATQNADAAEQVENVHGFIQEEEGRRAAEEGQTVVDEPGQGWADDGHGHVPHGKGGQGCAQTDVQDGSRCAEGDPGQAAVE